jgi:molybdopterin-guanine dinucleotide biosynthesis protein A
VSHAGLVWLGEVADKVGPTAGLVEAVARARAARAAWAADAQVPMVIERDATLVTSRADKEDAAPTYKRTYGHHPLLAIEAYLPP